MKVTIPQKYLRDGMLATNLPHPMVTYRVWSVQPTGEDTWVDIDLSDRITFLLALDTLYLWAFPNHKLTGALVHYPYRLDRTWGLAVSHDPASPMLTWGAQRKRTSGKHIDCAYSDDPGKGLVLGLQAAWGQP